MADETSEDMKIAKPQSDVIEKNQKWWLRFVPDAKKWTDVNILRFLSVYKVHPILWDPTHSFYKDRSRRMKAYGIIARRLNLLGVSERECVRLMESLKAMYAEEKRKQMIEKRCSRKYVFPSTWYRILEEMIESVQTKLAQSSDKVSSVKAEPAKPWQACCPRLYTEDIWTPEHFKTNVMNWFLAPQDQQLFCTCQHFSETTVDNKSDTEKSSAHSDSVCNSSNGINPSDSSDTCCPKICGDSLYSKEEDSDVSVALLSCCGQNDNSNDRYKYGKKSTKCKSKKQYRRIKEDGGLCDDNSSYTTICGEKLNVCGNEPTEKPSTEISTCPKNNNALCDSTNVCGNGYQDKPSLCGGESEISKDSPMRCDLQSSTDKFSPHDPSKMSFETPMIRPCGPRHVLNFCSSQSFSDDSKGSELSTKRETSTTTQSNDTCLSDSGTLSSSLSNSSEQTSSEDSNCKPICVKEESDHRLDYHPDPTLCEKCAADRVPIPAVHKNVLFFQDPRMPELDKYCRYKDWDQIYNIRTKVPDEEPNIQIDTDWLLMMQSKDEPSKPKRDNHLHTEADVHLFIDPESSEVRQVSLNNEYKYEYGLNIRIKQPGHYACKVPDAPGDKPAQLLL